MGPISPQLCRPPCPRPLDFNLSKIINEAQPANSQTSTAATNPTWLVGAEHAVVHAVQRWAACQGVAVGASLWCGNTQRAAVCCAEQRSCFPCFGLQAPEIVSGGRATAESDVYSFGLVRGLL